LICYSKHDDDSSNVILVVVNLDPHHTQSGWVDLDLAELGLPDSDPYQMHDLLSGARYLWHGSHNYVELNPHAVPAHILRPQHEVRSEDDSHKNP
jgi:starch synthase (maltosyl-transferring)